jgi:methylmalonyl-CoA mutase cobalamin-binding subunit
MKRVRLFHWKSEDGLLITDILRRAGFEVDYDAEFSPKHFRAVRDAPPDAVVIDLSRLPSHGREIATALRGNKRTRQVPILFLGGAPEKIVIVRQKLPDAAYCAQARLVAAVRKCIKERPVEPVVPTQMMDRYAARTAAQKLGIAAGSRVAVIDAPRDYARVIGDLPEGVDFDEESWAGCPVTLWFVEEPESFLAALPKMRKAAAISKLWVAWPKKAARKDSQLSETFIREMAIESGLVDYKICSINQTWSGLCFALKKAGRA